jgi:hypothetical protein
MRPPGSSTNGRERAFEARAHREQMVDRDRAHARIGVLRHEAVQERRDPLVDAGENAPRHRGAGERRHHRFGHRFDVYRMLEPGAAEGLGHVLRAIAGHEQRVQPSQCRRPRQRLLEQRGIQAGRARAGGRWSAPRGRRARRPERVAAERQQCRRGDHLAPPDQAPRQGRWRRSAREIGHGVRRCSRA